mmetsp:Transcript_77063/g.141066  ORF Transcript_77063/g.141066 Transcript_77063/m.141066 type:complete len:226 (+) Transcript_77063:27-704(+)
MHLCIRFWKMPMSFARHLLILTWQVPSLKASNIGFSDAPCCPLCIGNAHRKLRLVVRVFQSFLHFRELLLQPRRFSDVLATSQLSVKPGLLGLPLCFSGLSQSGQKLELLVFQFCQQLYLPSFRLLHRLCKLSRQSLLSFFSRLPPTSRRVRIKAIILSSSSFSIPSFPSLLLDLLHQLYGFQFCLLLQERIQTRIIMYAIIVGIQLLDYTPGWMPVSHWKLQVH